MAGGADDDLRGAARVRIAAVALLLAGLLVAGLVLVPRDAGEIRDAVGEAGAIAPVAFVAAAAALTVSFFPFPVVAAAGGLLFGVAAGTALSLAGETLGATAALLVARYGAREQTRRLAGPRMTAFLDGVARRGFSAVLLVRVLPGVPRHPANYVFGLTAVGVLTFASATALGTVPRALAYAALGGTLGDLTSPASIAAVTGLAVVGALGLWLAARDPDLRAFVRARRSRLGRG